MKDDNNFWPCLYWFLTVKSAVFDHIRTLFFDAPSLENAWNIHPSLILPETRIPFSHLHYCQW